MKYKNHIKTPNSVILMFKGSDPLTVPKENPEFDRVVRLLEAGRYDVIPKAANRVLRLKESSKGLYDVIDGRVVIQNEELPPTLSERILEFVDQGLPIQTFLNFWANLRDNPSEGSKEDLFNFLEKNHVPLTEDGCFVCYKKVRSGYWDCHTGKTHQYIPGTVVKMPRSEVNASRHVACASGLHVAGWGYLSQFDGDLVVEVKVNPKNVVAVPTDHDFTKIRVCELEVIRQCPKYMDEDVQYYDDDHATGFEDTDEEEARQASTSTDEDNEEEAEYENFEPMYCDDCEELIVDCLCEDEEEEDVCDSCRTFGCDGECVEDDEEVEDWEYDDEEEDEEEEEIVTISIRRIPSWLRWVVPSSDGRLRIPLAALEKIDVESGQTIYAHVPNNRTRHIVLQSNKPDDCLKLRTVRVGTASARIPASLFRAAQIHLDDGVDEYKLSCVKGTIVIRSA